MIGTKSGDLLFLVLIDKIGEEAPRPRSASAGAERRERSAGHRHLARIGRSDRSDQGGPMADNKGVLTEFKEFILRGNVVDLAVAVVIGAAFGTIVTALVKDLITPIIAAIVGKPDFGNLTFVIHKSRFSYG